MSSVSVRLLRAAMRALAQPAWLGSTLSVMEYGTYVYFVVRIVHFRAHHAFRAKSAIHMSMKTERTYGDRYDSWETTKKRLTLR